ncbi:DUF1707 SHOCT-like domain-containing protein, partial [Streptomyces sp. NPDC004129]
MAAPNHHRIGDQERETAARQLGEHFASGRLTKSQLDERLGVVLAAETAPALNEALHDLPEPSVPVPDRKRRGRWAAVAARLKSRRGTRALVLALAAWGAGGVLFGADWLLSCQCAVHRHPRSAMLPVRQQVDRAYRTRRSPRG